MTRRELREQLFVLLFQKEFYGEEMFGEQRDIHFQTHTMEEKEQTYLIEKLGNIGKRQEELDAMISEHSKGWKIDRIGKEELAILRLGVYEAVFDEDIPVGVAINEAVELAKKYGTDDSSSFVNGILAKIP